MIFANNLKKRSEEKISRNPHRECFCQIYCLPVLIFSAQFNLSSKQIYTAYPISFSGCPKMLNDT